MRDRVRNHGVRANLPTCIRTYGATDRYPVCRRPRGGRRATRSRILTMAEADATSVDRAMIAAASR